MYVCMFLPFLASTLPLSHARTHAHIHPPADLFPMLREEVGLLPEVPLCMFEVWAQKRVKWAWACVFYLGYWEGWG